ncbi:MAG: HD domain-containing protein [Chloroflexi bacterium]|nr:HD domain-containing protein [Chloroflexota bacterium]
MIAETPEETGELSSWLERVERELVTLPERLQAHVARTRTVGAELSALLNAPAARVELAIAGHDLYRALSDDEWLAEARRRGLPVDEFAAAEPIQLHGPLAASWMADEGGVADQEVLDAVRYHTTFAPGLGVLAATVFLADKIDPDKLRRPGVKEVARLARAGEWRAAIVAHQRTVIRWLEENGHTIHPGYADAIADLERG